jgi:hypothetical protein
MMKRKFLSLFVLVLAAIAAQNATAMVVMEFEDLLPNHTYNVGDSFITSGIQVQVEPFYPVAGGELSGTALVDNSQFSGGGPGQELMLNNVNLKFLLNINGCPACFVYLLFGRYGGDVNLSINGDIKKAPDFTNLNLLGTIGGAMVAVHGYPMGDIMAFGGSNISSFTVGGQDLFIDRLIICEVPEPNTVMLLGLGGLGLLAGRKKA